VSARKIDWKYWANPERCFRRDWSPSDSGVEPCASEIINEAEDRGWKGDNGWESCDSPPENYSAACSAVDENEETALEFIWQDILRKEENDC